MLNEQPSLQIHEWLAIVVILCFIAMLTYLSRPDYSVHLSPVNSTHVLMPSHIEIGIDGAVEYPGKYTVKKGSTLQDVLEQAKVLSTAELKHLNLKSKLRKEQSIHIPKQEIITIYLEGAVVKPGPYEFPKGTRLMDLNDKSLFRPNANIKFLAKKRKLKQNEIISVPFSD